MEVEAVGDEFTYGDRIFGDAALWLRSSPFVPVLDRAVFRFSSPDVRRAARGLVPSGTGAPIRGYESSAAE